MDRFKQQQARIDALFEQSKPASAPTHVYERLLDCAKTGADQPDSLTLQQIRDVCLALIAHYAQMGIG